jgi:hypothetical protein
LGQQPGQVTLIDQQQHPDGHHFELWGLGVGSVDQGLSLLIDVSPVEQGTRNRLLRAG